MIVDTSALLAVLFREDEASRFEALIAESRCRMSVANVLEAAMVLESRGGRAAGTLDAFLASAEIATAPVTLARTTSEPLLFKGNAFARTDIAAA